MRFRQVIAIIIAVVLVGCTNSSKEFKGYSVTKTGIHYKLISLGDGYAKAKPTDYITVNIAYRTTLDSLFFQGYRRFQLTDSQFEGSIDECFAMLSQGDSASFYISASNFFAKTIEADLPGFFKETDYLRVDMRLLEIQTEKQYQNEKEAFLHWIDDFGEYEKILLKQYIEEEKLDFEPTESGLYYIPVQTGYGNKIQQGDTITVHYEGRFFNGKIFDSTRKRNEPFVFVLGQKWQVVEGLEEAIGMMYPGERALFIIPSRLGFGEGGSSTGIVPPFTSVLFDVEVVDVKLGRR
ncbi:MAG TPA: FKBP-type peptidyl-prolyl cis-trans isomerase [Tenuifilaceae bacterium]|nr:FKBP-type peptidyl-prolyl cis-trans isomerase [Tenuifilaceae bacterium]HPE17968.1 FKBP-type peptidyl-prolyl cis-trans isomerase [Tenuifilaceae bacterium]HPJ44910.1 FKBP-type peptidyl-prolyl cis-trans isomerase [Tenuifilaceae bacterium]HPQ33124.1 FKBP-type peptidyl-prolyl cis-trans isomerase [Tenuifilaceae bacterium]HRX67056.1 FKBP-type peptidyl-prolyl cis-trans isomerase [Tenuifilaceae bacterium]